VSLPELGRPTAELIAELAALRGGDWRWRAGRSFGLVYHLDDDHADALAAAQRLFAAENAVSASAFPSVARMEAEVVAMVAELLSGDAGTAGAMTSGGTESILLAVKACRDAWKLGHAGRPHMVVPASAHPAFLKAAAYFEIDVTQVAWRPDFAADPAAMRSAIGPRTALLAASAPSLPHGIVDPIPEIGQLAVARGLWLHVDACLGAFVLPFLREAGEPVAPFDLSVPGVTSISADLHKYGFAPKGTSVVLYREAAARRHQFFATDAWVPGPFGSPGLLGTRPGGSVAGAWLALHRNGRSGYRRIAARVLGVSRALMSGIAAIPGLRVLGSPAMSVFAFTSDDRDILALADSMEEKGWRLDRQDGPPAIHAVVTPVHEPIVGEFLADLADATARAPAGPARVGRRAGPYGLVGDLAAEADPVGQILESLEARWGV
jgi:glutamate/tyrosine decarboxylase-like PLP-dependent enzyme